MGLFDKNKRSISSIEELQIKEPVGKRYPENLDSERFYKSSVIGSIFLGLAELGDIDDFKALSQISGRTFYEKNVDILSKIVDATEDNLEEFAILINEFLHSKGLGYFQMIVNEYDKQLYIKHFNSPFAFSLKGIYSDKVCFFLIEFYSLLFSLAFEEEIKFREVHCSAENKEYCLFELIK